jgi:hypothetical protein
MSQDIKDSNPDMGNMARLVAGYVITGGNRLNVSKVSVTHGNNINNGH